MKAAPSLLVLNPGSTSTKLAWFKGARQAWEEEIQHSPRELARFATLFAQLDWRCGLVENTARQKKCDPYAADAVVGRGGLMRPLPGGTYRIDADMCKDLRQSRRIWGLEHASNLGAEMALRFASSKERCFVVDPVATDEMQPLARVSGLPEYRRASLMHALNTRAVGRWAASRLGKPFNKVNLVVAHLGGGASVTAVQGGRFVDTSNAVAGQGPMTANRAGSLPTSVVADLASRPGMTRDKVLNLLLKKAGLFAYTGTDKLPEVIAKARGGDARARLAFEALCYQVAKDLGAYAAVLSGKVDAVVITGGMAHQPDLVRLIRRRAGFLGRFLVYPGQLEMQAMARGALRVLTGEEKALRYPHD